MDIFCIEDYEQASLDSVDVYISKLLSFTQFFLENVKDHPYVTGNEGSRPIIIETLKFLYDLEMIAQRDGEVATPEIARPRVPHEVMPIMSKLFLLF